MLVTIRGSVSHAEHHIAAGDVVDLADDMATAWIASGLAAPAPAGAVASTHWPPVEPVAAVPPAAEASADAPAKPEEPKPDEPPTEPKPDAPAADDAAKGDPQ